MFSLLFKTAKSRVTEVQSAIPNNVNFIARSAEWALSTNTEEGRDEPFIYGEGSQTGCSINKNLVITETNMLNAVQEQIREGERGKTRASSKKRAVCYSPTGPLITRVITLKTGFQGHWMQAVVSLFTDPCFTTQILAPATVCTLPL